MPGQLVIVSDAHLGAAPAAVEEAFLAFLEAVPDLGDCLLINGDLFDFWFSYRRVVPRQGVAVAAALGALRRRLPIVMVGGNHDRWGQDFWRDDLGITFEPLEARFEVDGRVVLAVHGDGITERHWSGKFLHHLLRHPATITLFRWIHPDLGYRIADLVTDGAVTPADPALLDQAAERQQAWAEQTMRADPSLGLLVMGHTHRSAVAEFGPGRHYVNPGPWYDGLRYAVATSRDVQLRQWADHRPLRAPPADAGTTMRG
ncbi:MAG: UDP-2,3-diacylglucosamine diphosphatase [Gemmatimonadota bacterium]